MSYAHTVALQSALYQHLSADTDLAGLVDGAVFDMLPPGPVPPLYVVLGAETAVDRSDVTGHGSLHLITISIVAAGGGFAAAKAAAAVVHDAVAGAELTLMQGRLVYLNFDRAVARRSGTAGEARQIDLRFRARLDED